MANLLGNKYFSGMVTLLLVLYAVFVAPALPNQVLYFFDTAFGKLLFIFLTTYVASEGNVQVSIMIAIALYVTLTLATRKKIQENFYEGFSVTGVESEDSDEEDESEGVGAGGEEGESEGVGAGGEEGEEGEEATEEEVASEEEDAGSVEEGAGGEEDAGGEEGAGAEDEEQEQGTEVDTTESFANFSPPSSGGNLLNKEGVRNHAPVRF